MNSLLWITPLALAGVAVAGWFLRRRRAAASGEELISLVFLLTRPREVDQRIGATHYTVLASLEVLGKAPGGPAGGFVAASAGYGPCFAIAAVLSIAYLPLLRAYQRRATGPSAVARPRRPITIR